MDSKIFGEVIKAWRLWADISQKELARKAGLSESTVGAIERGERRLSDENFVKICIGLGITVEEVFNAGYHVQLQVLHRIEGRLRGGRSEEAPRGETGRQPSREQMSEIIQSWTAQTGEFFLSLVEYARSAGPETPFRTPPPAPKEPSSGRPPRARVGRSRQRAQRK